VAAAVQEFSKGGLSSRVIQRTDIPQLGPGTKPRWGPGEAETRC